MSMSFRSLFFWHVVYYRYGDRSWCGRDSHSNTGPVGDRQIRRVTDGRNDQKEGEVTEGFDEREINAIAHGELPVLGQYKPGQEGVFTAARASEGRLPCRPGGKAETVCLNLMHSL